MTQRRVTDIKKRLVAASRQIEISRFHYHELEKILPSAKPDERDMPPIPVQAFFEGTVISAFAAIDKLLGAIARHYSVPREFEQLANIESFAPGSKNLQDKENFYRDLKKSRNEAVHESLTKTHEGLVWMVKKPNRTGYTGARDILRYSKAAVEFAQACAPVIEELEKNWVTTL